MMRSFRSEDIPGMSHRDLLNAFNESPDSLVFTELLSRLEKLDELQQTLHLEHSRVRVIAREWQKAHGKPNVIPDLGMLIDWMWGEVKVKCAPHEPGENLEDQYCPLCGSQLTR